MNYDDDYSKTKELFGSKAEPTVAKFQHLLEPGGLILDIGAGQGRNCLPLAQAGFVVHAIEPSSAAADAISKCAAETSVAINVHAETIENFHRAEKFDGIMVFGLIPDLEWLGIEKLVEKIRILGKHGTLVWLTGFTTNDPGLYGVRQTWQEIAPNSFRHDDGRVRTYLEPRQILHIFKNRRVLHHWEGLGQFHRHGDSARERHGLFEVVFELE
ncbi:MAG: class I SAM-dependent methyltransferase [Planctomycetes bacterium]|nr:class I SAM-dependent methyltransferase [Planctomycetota bacterium]